MMVYVDTNILIYASYNQDIDKLRQSQSLLTELKRNKTLIISPLVLQEFIFTCAKLKLPKMNIEKQYKCFRAFSNGLISQELLDNAYDLTATLDFQRNINDAIHLKFAEKYCSKLITFDSDFKKFFPYTNLEIEILY